MLFDLVGVRYPGWEPVCWEAMTCRDGGMPRLAEVACEAGASLLAFPSWSLGTSEAGAWERAHEQKRVNVRKGGRGYRCKPLQSAALVGF